MVTIQEAKARLQEELERALAELARLEESLETKGDYGLGVGDPNIYQWEFNLALRQRAEDKVKAIRKALQRAEAGKYGICEVCGERIEDARLEMFPYTTFCSRCARSRR